MLRKAFYSIYSLRINRFFLRIKKLQNILVKTYGIQIIQSIKDVDNKLSIGNAIIY